MNNITYIKKFKDIIFSKDFDMNITEIFNILVKPNIGHTVTIKNAKEGWFGKEFIHNEDVTGILEECNILAVKFTSTILGNDCFII